MNKSQQLGFIILIVFAAAGMLSLAQWKHNRQLRIQSVSEVPKSEKSIRVIPLTKKEDRLYFPKITDDQFQQHQVIVPPEPKVVKTIPITNSQVPENSGDRTNDQPDQKQENNVRKHIIHSSQQVDSNDICERHNLKKVWYDNHRRWRCNRI